MWYISSLKKDWRCNLFEIINPDGPRKGKHSGLRLYADDSDTDYVELPAAGYRNHYKESEDIISSGAYGMYWSSSSYENDNADAYALHYYLGAVNTEWYNKNMAFSVRLVMDVDPCTLE